MNIINRFTGKTILTTETDLMEINLAGTDLRGASLKEANLIGADLCEADLYEADLTRANLTGANLTGANLTGANLTGANLTGANLAGTDLRGANLAGADLTGADLTRADLIGADLCEADLTRVDLTGAKNYYPQLYCLKQMPPETYLTLYKYVTKDFKSPTSFNKITYEIGKTYMEKDYDCDERIECGKGLSVATLQWCLLNKNEEDIIIEVRFKVKDIVAIPYATDGKIRVKEMRVIRKFDI